MSQNFFDGGPKTMFFTGLFLGIAVSAVVGLGVTLNLVMGGNALAVGGNSGAYVPPSGAQAPAAQAPVAAGPLKPVSANDHLLGPKNAKVTLVEYSDFQCPFCSRHLPTVKQALKDFPNEVNLVYRHYPLSFHPEAQKSAEASECAAKLGGNDAFWKMHDELFTNQATLSRSLYTELAKKIGLNTVNFDKCLDGGEMAAKVNTDLQDGTTAGVEGTPATFVNGQLISGAVPYSELKAAIQAALK
ncbi:DsbA family protein [Candidatus Uhrbacteria bacterium]|nr:MAG: DsbA family protein [Candidatus Uhrbacteria bacterium]